MLFQNQAIWFEKFGHYMLLEYFGPNAIFNFTQRIVINYPEMPESELEIEIKSELEKTYWKSSTFFFDQGQETNISPLQIAKDLLQLKWLFHHMEDNITSSEFLETHPVVDALGLS